jgi:hypothetical protein
MKVIENIVSFMDRVQLAGKEVPAFNECMNFLARLHQEATNPQPKPQPAPAVDSAGIPPKHPAEYAADGA